MTRTCGLLTEFEEKLGAVFQVFKIRRYLNKDRNGMVDNESLGGEDELANGFEVYNICMKFQFEKMGNLSLSSKRWI